MKTIASDKKLPFQLSRVLEAYDSPAILVSSDYEILSTNSLYQDQFGDLDLNSSPNCYQVSHGFEVPCDQAGESCPLNAAKKSGKKERVLHIHQTPRGKEHVDVEMIPILNDKNEVDFFIEILKPVPLATGAVSDKKMVGSSYAFNSLIENIARVGKSDASVLLLGESGTGKELVAKAIHMASDRKNKPLVTLECSGLTDSLFESELFGHVKGAFTGAHITKKGLIEHVEGGTLFLDEIADVPLNIQVKLLRLIESHTYRSVGSSETKIANFRLICATHKNIETMVEEGSFRQDLYYRINVFPIYLPSLNDRASDIPEIAKHLLSEIGLNTEYHITDSAMKLLIDYKYRGNIRELRNIIMRSIVFSDTNMIDKNIILKSIQANQPNKFHKNLAEIRLSKNDRDQKIHNDNLSLKENEKNYFLNLMNNCKNDKKKAARIAGISLRSLYRKLEQFDIL
ncbi:MAG: sigma-54 dependent transcriptional regulator [Cellvibrionaceae bacterium]